MVDMMAITVSITLLILASQATADSGQLPQYLLIRGTGDYIYWNSDGVYGLQTDRDNSYCKSQGTDTGYIYRNSDTGYWGIHWRLDDSEPWYRSSDSKSITVPSSGWEDRYNSYTLNPSISVTVLCSPGGNDAQCPWYINNQTTLALSITLIMVIIGVCLFFLTKESKHEQGSDEEETAVSRDVDRIVRAVNELKKTEEGWESLGDLTEEFRRIHDGPGQMHLLVAGFIFINDPQKRNILATFLHDQERNIHANNDKLVRKCIRKKSGSNKETEAYLDHISSPGCTKALTYHMEKTLDWRFSGITRVVIPLLKVFGFLLDSVKDVFLWSYIYLYSFPNADSDVLKGLIWLHLSSIFVAQTVMGLKIMSRASMDIKSRIPSFPLRILLHILLFFLTPLLPIVIILKSVACQSKKSRIVTDWRIQAGSPSVAIKKYMEVAREKKQWTKLYSQLRMLECNIEALPQLTILSTYIMVSFALLSQDNTVIPGTSEALYLIIGNTIYTFITSITALLNTTNMRKARQIGVKAKVLLFLSYGFQIAGVIIPMVTVNVLAIEGHIPVLPYVLSLTLPTILHWTSLYILYYCTVPPFHELSVSDKLLHILSNTFLCIPLHNQTEDQRHKSREQFWTLLLAAFKIIGISASAAVAATRYGYILAIIVPSSLFLHLLGCMWLVLYYRTAHTWRSLTSERSERRRSALCGPWSAWCGCGDLGPEIRVEEGCNNSPGETTEEGDPLHQEERGEEIELSERNTQEDLGPVRQVEVVCHNSLGEVTEEVVPLPQDEGREIELKDIKVHVEGDSRHTPGQEETQGERKEELRGRKNSGGRPMAPLRKREGSNTGGGRQRSPREGGDSGKTGGKPMVPVREEGVAQVEGDKDHPGREQTQGRQEEERRVEVQEVEGDKDQPGREAEGTQETQVRRQLSQEERRGETELAVRTGTGKHGE